MNQQRFRFILLVATALFVGCQETDSNPRSESSEKIEVESRESDDSGHDSQELCFISGAMPVKWASAKWLEGDSDEDSDLRLALSKDTEWQLLECQEGERISLLLVYIREGHRGQAAKVIGYVAPSYGYGCAY